MLFSYMALVALHVKTCKAAANTLKPQRLLHPADRLLPSFPLRVVTSCLGGVGDVTDFHFPLRCSCNGVNLAPHWAIPVQPHPMKDTLVPSLLPSITQTLLSFSHLTLSLPAASSLLLYMAQSIYDYFLCYSSSAYPSCSTVYDKAFSWGYKFDYNMVKWRVFI